MAAEGGTRANDVRTQNFASPRKLAHAGGRMPEPCRVATRPGLPARAYRGTGGLNAGGCPNSGLQGCETFFERADDVIDVLDAHR